MGGLLRRGLYRRTRDVTDTPGERRQPTVWGGRRRSSGLEKSDRDTYWSKGNLRDQSERKTEEVYGVRVRRELRVEFSTGYCVGVDYEGRYLRERRVRESDTHEAYCV